MFPENFAGSTLDHVLGGVVGIVMGGLIALGIDTLIRSIARKTAHRRKGVSH